MATVTVKEAQGHEENGLKKNKEEGGGGAET